MALSERELDQARSFLRQTQNAVIDATRGLSDSQWNFKPSPGRWSIAENLDHIVIVLEHVLGPVMDQLANAPAPSESIDCEVVDAIIINQFPARLTRATAPEFLNPAAEIHPQELLEKLTKQYANLNERFTSTPDLRRHAIEAPPLTFVTNNAYSLMDGYQWLLAAAAHTERHARQMREVMATPGYPM
jgi:hypothetical protein